MNPITLDSDRALSVCGVPGRLTHRTVKPGTAPALFTNQCWVSQWREYKEGATKCRIQVNIRFDDSCGNGHNSFAITGNTEELRAGSWREDSGGCIHEEIAKHFPELAHLIQWHLCNSTSPTHYLANVVYLAGDRDCHGLRAGESRHIRNGRTGNLCWHLEAANSLGIGISSTPTGDKYRHSETVPLFILTTDCQGDAPPLATPVLKWVPSLRVGEGKARELDAARRAAIWPEATDAELTQDPEQLRAALAARLPALIERFRADITAAGFAWSPADVTGE